MKKKNSKGNLEFHFASYELKRFSFSFVEEFEGSFLLKKFNLFSMAPCEQVLAVQKNLISSEISNVSSDWGLAHLKI